MAGRQQRLAFVDLLLERLYEVNLMRSNLSSFHRLVGNDPAKLTYQPLLSKIIEMVDLKISPTTLSDLVSLKDYNSAERTVSGVTESLTGLLGGFFSSSTVSRKAQAEKPTLLLSDRDLVFIFVTGGLTMLEIDDIRSKYAGHSTRVIIGTTKLIDSDSFILQQIFSCCYKDLVNNEQALDPETSRQKEEPDVSSSTVKNDEMPGNDGDGWDNDDGWGDDDLASIKREFASP